MLGFSMFWDFSISIWMFLIVLHIYGTLSFVLMPTYTHPCSQQ